MNQSSTLIDESSRLKQFAWEQWDDQTIAVIFRPGNAGLDRYVVKRYVEQVFAQSERWKQLSFYFTNITPAIRAYALTSHEIELMRRILDYHLSDKLHLRVTLSSDQLIQYEDLLDFLFRAQELSVSNPHRNTQPINGKKPSIPVIQSSYILPSSVKSTISSSSTESKPRPVKPPPPLQPNKTQTSKPLTNGHQSNLPIPPALSLASLQNARIDGSGWIQINNVYIPFIIKNRQRIVPYQVLVSCKILEPDELRSTLMRANSTDLILINSMIRDCKINNEQIPENAFLINVRHILIGTKTLIYAKLLPKDNPTSAINRQYKSVLALRGGSIYITTRRVPFVCTSNHTYLALEDILNIYPNLYSQLKSLARVPRTNELDYLQLIQMYYDVQELPSDTLLIDMEDLNQTQIIPSKSTTLHEYHTNEKSKFEQQIRLLGSNKRKYQEAHENRQIQEKIKPSTLIRPPTGYFPPSSSSSHQQNPYLSANNGHHGKTRWQ